MEQQTKNLAKVNGITLLLIDEEDKLIPIRPICDALGIDEKTQVHKIKQDEDLNSVAGLSPATGADKKEYQMYCLPLKYVFGWLFTINPKNVKPEAQDAVRSYRRQCYDVLYFHFAAHTLFLKDKDKRLTVALENQRDVKTTFHAAKEKLTEATSEVYRLKDLSFDEWMGQENQLRFTFQGDAS